MNATCFECGRGARHAHHVVPESLGGTRTIPLCVTCHKQVHSPGQALSLGTLNHVSRRDRLIVWTCDVCGQSIANGAGYLDMRYRELHEFNCLKEEWYEAHPPSAAGWTVRPLTDWDSYPERVRWHVLHRACDEEIDSTSYWVGVERLRNLSELVHFTAHVVEKKWFADTDWPRILRSAALHTRMRVA